ncbi:uncharacterized protein FFUJ_10293 [Fusarium fujikuroi IMI 58289]|uniref:HAD-like protein n=1 Tax=Gibberella fujikuroi (strain CBS 195.34 / IMI 58289 / NRRL A-6831) TaxID=1279085 RepID=S0EHW7_GIBF5|nr:uncharacterized protein FFUJ_10293 [Fusarium fujikuroi IMI 58289]CCT74250.1 uncharacterized protein FFUJ_10293 [Fusarium fujikuroi IMI 58289]
MHRPNYTTVIFDLGGVLLNYSSKNTVGLTATQIKSALDSPYWHEYERGKVSKQEAYEQVTQAFKIDLETWTDALEQMKDGMQPNEALISAIKDLKTAYPTVKICCLSNIPGPELALLKDEIESWGIIDQFVASSHLQRRKLEMGTYSAFLEKIQESAPSCIFIDDKVGSVVNAQCLGFKGIVFTTTDELIRVLYNLLGDPVSRAKAYLKQNAKNLFCMINTGNLQPDNFSQLLILHHTGDRDLIMLKNEGVTWNYFHGSPTYDGTTYPDDPDTTCLAMTMLDDVSMEQKLKARDVILSHVNNDGLPEVSADSVSKDRPRFCHCVCANVFRFFTINDWTEKLPGVYEYLCRVLENRAFLHGSRYYKIPDWFLYILSDLCARRPSDEKLQRMRDLLIECVQERMGCDDNILGAAMRALSAQSLGVKNDRDLRILLESQQLDGGWELAWLWSYATKPLKIGSRGVVTAMAMDAIQRAMG